MRTNAELNRLEEARNQKAPWKQWGPYLSERQWGTVREDYTTPAPASPAAERFSDRTSQGHTLVPRPSKLL